MNANETSAPTFDGIARGAGGRPLTARAAYPMAVGVASFAILIAVYVSLLTALSGWDFTVEQVASYWYYLVPLAAGFGVQVGLYTRLRQVVGRSRPGRAVVAASGTTSTAAMVSCCSHYLVNLLPVLGASGLVALAAQYQVEFFWLGLVANAAGVVFIAIKLFEATREHANCTTASAAKTENAFATDPVGGMTVDPNDAARSAMQRDPVCGMQVDPQRAAAKRSVQDRAYYFCSQGCAASFDKNPPLYSKADAQLQPAR
jgi:YHS domain-containing protein